MKSLVECLLEESKKHKNIFKEFTNPKEISKEEAFKLLSESEDYYLGFDNVTFSWGMGSDFTHERGILQIFKTHWNDGKPYFGFHVTHENDEDEGVLCYPNEVESIDDMLKHNWVKGQKRLTLYYLPESPTIESALKSDKITIYKRK